MNEVSKTQFLDRLTGNEHWDPLTVVSRWRPFDISEESFKTERCMSFDDNGPFQDQHENTGQVHSQDDQQTLRSYRSDDTESMPSIGTYSGDARSLASPGSSRGGSTLSDAAPDIDVDNDIAMGGDEAHDQVDTLGSSGPSGLQEPASDDPQSTDQCGVTGCKIHDGPAAKVWHYILPSTNGLPQGEKKRLLEEWELMWSDPDMDVEKKQQQHRHRQVPLLCEGAILSMMRALERKDWELQRQRRRLLADPEQFFRDWIDGDDNPGYVTHRLKPTGTIFVLRVIRTARGKPRPLPRLRKEDMKPWHYIV